MKPFHLAIGLGALLLLSRKKKASPKTQRYAAAMTASQAAAQLSTQLKSSAVSAKTQLEMLVKRLQQGRPGRSVVGAVFGLTENQPNRWQIATLFALDPDFVLEQPGHTPMPIRILLEAELEWEDRKGIPEESFESIRSIAFDGDVEQKIRRGIALLPMSELESFLGDLLERSQSLADDLDLGPEFRRCVEVIRETKTSIVSPPRGGSRTNATEDAILTLWQRVSKGALEKAYPGWQAQQKLTSELLILVESAASALGSIEGILLHKEANPSWVHQFDKQIRSHLQKATETIREIQKEQAKSIRSGEESLKPGKKVIEPYRGQHFPPEIWMRKETQEMEKIIKRSDDEILESIAKRLK